MAEPTPKDDEDDEEDPAVQATPLKPGVLESLQVDGQRVEELNYYLNVDGERPYLFFSYGLEEEQAASERERIEANERAPGDEIMLFHSEPVALFSLLTFYQPDLFEPIDVGILAQRIGALSFRVSPERRGDVQRIRYDFVVGSPPQIDGTSTR